MISILNIGGNLRMNYKYVSFFNFSDYKESAYDQYHSFSGAHMDQLDQLVVWLEHFDLS